MDMYHFKLDGLIITAVMSVISQVLVFDDLKTAKKYVLYKNCSKTV